jgi:transposase-like protein
MHRGTHSPRFTVSPSKQRSSGAGVPREGRLGANQWSRRREPGVLAELGAVEQRCRAVLEVVDEGVSVTEVARRYWVVRQTVHTWLRRYAEDGLGGLVPPGRSAVHRVLVRHGLVQPRKRHRRREDYRRWERPRAMDLWQMYVMGRVYLADGAKVKIVTGIDDHSRFVVCAKAVMRATDRSVCQALAAALWLSAACSSKPQVSADLAAYRSRYPASAEPTIVFRVVMTCGSAGPA